MASKTAVKQDPVRTLPKQVQKTVASTLTALRTTPKPSR